MKPNNSGCPFIFHFVRQLITTLMLNYPWTIASNMTKKNGSCWKQLVGANRGVIVQFWILRNRSTTTTPTNTTTLRHRRRRFYPKRYNDVLIDLGHPIPALQLINDPPMSVSWSKSCCLLRVAPIHKWTAIAASAPTTPSMIYGSFPLFPPDNPVNFMLQKN